MREVKFRGKRIDNGEWVYGDLIENQGRFFIYHATSETTLIDHNDRDITVIATAVDNNTVGQFTSLKDKYGKEIYEGDIIKSKYTTYIVKWNKKCAYFSIQEDETPHLLADYNNDIEIIGNVYTNPELLKGGEE